MLDCNSGYMFRPNCRAIFRLIFEQVECKLIMLSTYDISLFKIIVVCYIKKLKIKIQLWYFIQQALQTDKSKLTGELGGCTLVGILSY